MGYFLSVPVATFSYVLVANVLNGTTRFEFFLNDLILLMLIVTLIVNYALALPPFLFVRFLAGNRFRRAWSGALGGALVGILYVPFGAMPATIDFERGPHPYLAVLAELLNSTVPLYWAAAGAIGGLTFWVVEYASFSWLSKLAQDTRPVRITGGLVSWRIVVAATGIFVLVSGVVGINEWWLPHVETSSGAGVPDITLQHDVIALNSFGIGWAPDGSKLISRSWPALMVRDATGNLLREINYVDGTWHPHPVFVGGRSVVAAGGNRTADLAFSVYDIATGEVVREEKIDPRELAEKGGAIASPSTFAISSDQSRLAVAFGAGHERHFIAVYSTRNWSRLFVLDNLAFTSVPDSVVLSGDGGFLAFANLNDISIVNVATGNIVQTIVPEPRPGLRIAFSPDGNLLAAITPKPNDGHQMVDQVQLFRVADGKQIASYSHATSTIYQLAWDSKGRLIAFVGGHSVVHLWNPFASEVSEKTITVRRDVTGIAFSPDGGRLAVANDGYISIFSIRD